jgi:hypothetical protein
MTWQYLPGKAQAWLLGDDSIVPVMDSTLWEVLVTLGRGHTVPELIRMALRGDFNLILARLASRVDDAYDRDHPKDEMLVSGTRLESSEPDSEESTLEIRFGTIDTTVNWVNDWIDVDRAWIEIARDPRLRRGLAVLPDLELFGEDWETLTRRYGKAKSTLQALRAEAQAALLRRLRPRS